MLGDQGVGHLEGLDEAGLGRRQAVRAHQFQPRCKAPDSGACLLFRAAPISSRIWRSSCGHCRKRGAQGVCATLCG